MTILSGRLCADCVTVSSVYICIGRIFISTGVDASTSRIVYSEPVADEVKRSMKDFMAEARRLHKVGIEHPNIVKVNEVFEANNTAYYVMEYLDGESLRSYVKRHGVLSEDEMLAVMRPVIDAVGYLHRNRMTHLDVKPDNIMIVKDDDGNVRSVLIDFGLSKHYGADGRPTSTINTLGCSDGYAPTEQYAGITTFSPTADIYALGATMLFCLTGRDPKKSTELRPGEIDSILSGLSLTVSTRDIIARAMATSQYDRAPSVDAMFNEHIVDSPSADSLLPVGAGRGLPADIGTPTARLNQEQRSGDFCEQRAGHGAAPTEPDKPTRPVTAASTTSRRPLIIGAVVAALLILAGILLFTRGGTSDDTPVIVADSTTVAVDSQQPVGAGHGLPAEQPAEQPAEPTGQPVAPQQPVEQPAPAPQPAAAPGHAQPADFDLACVRDGKYRYFTEVEWNRVSDKEKSKYTKKGIVLTNFIVALHDLTPEELNWADAMARYSSQLPDRAQGDIIAKNCDVLNHALSAFGGTLFDTDWEWDREAKRSHCPYYWTKVVKDECNAWGILVTHGGIGDIGRSVTYKVRGVAPLPAVSAM